MNDYNLKTINTFCNFLNSDVGEDAMIGMYVEMNLVIKDIGEDKTKECIKAQLKSSISLENALHIVETGIKLNREEIKTLEKGINDIYDQFLLSIILIICGFQEGREIAFKVLRNDEVKGNISPCDYWSSLYFHDGQLAKDFSNEMVQIMTDKEKQYISNEKFHLSKLKKDLTEFREVVIKERKKYKLG
jgi:hypothetical protein